MTKPTVNYQHYLIIGPENTPHSTPITVIEAAIKAGITVIQLRAKQSDAKEIIALAKETTDLLARLGKIDEVTLLINDRLDVVLTCLDQGIPVDGIHVGQDDIPVSVCRHYLGPDAIIGLSASVKDLLHYVATTSTDEIDYFGVGPLHPTATKPEAGRFDGMDGETTVRTLDEIQELVEISEIPVVVGGGVKANDLPALKETGVDGYFVISAITGADAPYEGARQLVTTWEEA